MPFQGILSMSVDETGAVATPPVSCTAVAPTLVTASVLHNSHASAGVLMAAPTPGIIASATPLSGVLATPPVPVDFQSVTQPVLNSATVQQLASLPPEMSATAMGIIPQLSMPVAQGHTVDQAHSTLEPVEQGGAEGDAGQVLGEQEQATGEDSHVSVCHRGDVPLQAPASVCMAGSVALAPGAQTAIPAEMTPGEYDTS